MTPARANLPRQIADALEAVTPALITATDPFVPLRVSRALTRAYEQLVAAELWCDDVPETATLLDALDRVDNSPF